MKGANQAGEEKGMKEAAKKERSEERKIPTRIRHDQVSFMLVP